VAESPEFLDSEKVSEGRIRKAPTLASTGPGVWNQFQWIPLELLQNFFCYNRDLGPAGWPLREFFITNGIIFNGLPTLALLGLE
jgi:hypothetical protein